jgi:RHS repeat-associated protein
MLSSVVGGGSNANVGYTYDGDGLLASRTSNNSTRQYAWAGAALLTDGPTSFIYGPGGLPIEQIGADGTPLFLHHDQLGSTRLVTDSGGAVQEALNYTPYGAATITSGTAVTPLTYAGQYTDLDTGLIYMRARWYDPASDQFVTPDPYSATTGLAYAYANDSPTSFIDPSGDASVTPSPDGPGGYTSGLGILTTTPPYDGGVPPDLDAILGGVVGLSYEECDVFDNGKLIAQEEVSGDDGASGDQAAGDDENTKIADVLAGLEQGRSEDVYEVPTEAELLDIYIDLSAGGTPVSNDYPGDMVEFPDGATVGLRDESKSGGPTIDITRPGHPDEKIHLP